MRENIAQYIDHTLLKPDATKESIKQLIEEAKRYHFKSVCIHPSWVKFCAKKLKQTNIEICTVVGFPLGAQTIETKVFEAKEAIDNGATEIDMVINIGRLKSKDDEYIERELEALIKVVKNRAVLKVIMETALLTKEEKIKILKFAKKYQVDFVKTSTGFAPRGATVEDIRLMKEIVSPDVFIKASGGIRTLKDAKQMIEAGATRIGASASVAIVEAKD